MRFVVGLFLLASICPAAIAGPKDDAMQVIDRWSKAFAASDVDGIVRLYAPDAHFMGTQTRTVVLKTDDIRKYFEQALLTNRPRSATLGFFSVAALSDTVVIVTGIDTVTGVRDGASFSNNGRVTFVIVKRAADWQIIQFHRSAMPN